MKSPFLTTIFISLHSALLAGSADAVTIAIQDPCSAKNWLQTEITSTDKHTVGELTIEALKNSDLKFAGSPTGINSINGTVTGLDAIEVISDKEMNAYGWCYKVDGREPTLLPSEMFIKTGDEKIHWFFAYSHYLNGKWLTMCTPTSKTKRKFICKKESVE